MPNPTRLGQVQYLMRLLESCPTACRVVIHNPALPSGVVVHIPAVEPPETTTGGALQPSEEVAVVPAANVLEGKGGTAIARRFLGYRTPTPRHRTAPNRHAVQGVPVP
jgi:hypothetical protein